MQPLQPISLNNQKPTPAKPAPPLTLAQKCEYLAIGAAGFVIWLTIYSQLLPVAHLIADQLLALEPGTHLSEAVTFFIYDTPKVFMLLIQPPGEAPGPWTAAVC